MKRGPSTDELEAAIASIVNNSDREMTAKEVREKLLQEKTGWKVPAERRIAKFVKRQHSRKEDKKEKRESIINKFFSKRNGTNKKTNSKNDAGGALPRKIPESHPAVSTTNSSALVDTTRLAEAEGVSLSKTPIQSSYVPMASAELVDEEPKDVEASKIEENGGAVSLDNSDKGAKDWISDAYIDDNDGKKRNCECDACVVL